MRNHLIGRLEQVLRLWPWQGITEHSVGILRN